MKGGELYKWNTRYTRYFVIEDISHSFTKLGKGRKMVLDGTRKRAARFAALIMPNPIHLG